MYGARMSATAKSSQAIHSRRSRRCSTSPSQRPVSYAHLRVELGGGPAAVEHADEVEARQGRLDGADRGEAPLDDAGAALDVARDQPAGLLGQAEHDGGRLGHHEAVVDDRRLAEGADPAVDARGYCIIQDLYAQGMSSPKRAVMLRRNTHTALAAPCYLTALTKVPISSRGQPWMR
jgi:hypothetical protein